MKKILLFVSALAGLFLAASCQQENLEPVGGNTVTYTVQVPGALSTKAIGTDVSKVTELIYEVYRIDENDVETRLYQKKASLTNGTATVELELVNNQDFRVLFWAQVPENGVYTTTSLKNVTLATGLNANAENYAAFAGQDEITYGENLAGRKITLVRPVAQLNIATSAESLKLGEDENGANAQTTVSFKTTAVTVEGLSTVYNVAEGAAGADEATFTYAAKPVALSETTLNVNGVDYSYVAMNYVGFAQPSGDNVKVTYTIETNEVGTITNTISNVPVKANYRTNIVGNLITSMSDYTVTLDKEWAGVAGEYEIWDGETLNAPTTNAAGEYMVSKPSEWAYLANQQNPATKADPVPVVINLTSDLDFGGNELTGLVAASNNSLTVKGNGYTIMNAKMVSGNNDNGTPCAALFVSLSSSELTVSDLNVKNVNVDVDQDPEWGYAAVLVAYAEGEVTLNNINVSNSTVYGTHSIGTAVGFIAAYSSVEINNFTADGIKLSNADVEGESGSMGGFAGRVAGKLAAENVKVSNSTIEAYVATASDQQRSIAKFIGNFVGGGEINVTGATVDNVTIVAKNELAETQQCLYTEYLGGWRGNGGTVSINGIEITKDQTNEDITVDTPAELAAAISNADDGAVIPVSGEIATTELKAGDGKSITIVGMTDDAAIDVKANTNYTNTSGNITFQNLTIKLNSNPAAHYNVGFHNNGGEHVYDNCKFEGCITAWGDCIYNNCEFVNTVEGKYAAWVYDGTVVYNNCTITAVNRAAKVFNENPNSNLNVTYNNCKFVASGTNKNKAAVEVAVMNNTAVATVVTINNPELVNMKDAEHFGTQAFNIEYEYEDKSKIGNGIVTLDGNTYACVSKEAPLLQALQMDSKTLTVQTVGNIDCYLNTGIAGVNTQEINISSTLKVNVLNITCASASYNGSYCTFRAVNPNAVMKFSNITLNKTANTQTTWNTYNMEFYTDVELTDCVIEHPVTFCTNAVVKNTTINGYRDTADHYAVWQQANGTNVTFENCAINGTRGIKIDEQYVTAAPSTLVVKNSAFATTGSKSAILVKSSAKVDITLDNVVLTNVTADQINAVWVDEDSAQYADLVTVTGGTVIVEP